MTQISASAGPVVTWVVPCFDEAARLDGDAFVALAETSAPARVLFVDDGSRDATLGMLQGLVARQPSNFAVMSLPSNQGKAEAVRQGLLRALADAADVVGYLDADLATPPAELARLARLMRASDFAAMLGSRVQLLGRNIERRHVRHYLGRVFATCASIVLRLPVYDTQCGAKLFRPTPALRAALAKPFVSRWSFDVELLGRLLRPGAGVAPVDPARMREEPLETWKDIPGSKLRPLAAVRSGLDLLRLARKIRRGL
jgi:dolichyl-phosphate beta-glucosyltransferase